MMRTARPTDIPRLMEIERSAPSAAHWAEADYNRIFAQDATPRIALVFEEGLDVVGFVVATAIGERWEIENVVVDPQYQRMGVGGHMVRRLLEYAHQYGAEVVGLEVRDSNAAARALYRTCGFKESGRRPNYYRNPDEDAVLYDGKPTPPRDESQPREPHF